MSVSWECFAGDTSVVAAKIALHNDPDGGSCANPDESASWGGMQFYVDGRNLFAHTMEGGVFQECRWYMLPLLEWFAENWDPLFHEERLPIRVVGESAGESLEVTRYPKPGLEEGDITRQESDWGAWWSRHCLLAGREGGFFPELYIRRKREALEVSWRESRTAGLPEGFKFSVPEGAELFSPGEVAKPLYEVCIQLAQELSKRVPRSQRLKKLVRAWKGIAKGKDLREHRLAWMAGLGVNARSVRARWEAVKRKLTNRPKTALRSFFNDPAGDIVLEGSCQAALMFGSLAPDIGTDDIVTLADAALKAYRPSGDPFGLPNGKDILEGIPKSRPPWQQGYDLAMETLERFRVSRSEGFIDVESLLAGYGVEIDVVRLGDDTVRGVSIAGPRHCPTILVNENWPENERSEVRRFTIAHEFCHLLFDRELGAGFALASGPWAPREVERRANAFAAMFLMPPEFVREAAVELKANLGTEGGVTLIASRLRASFSATLEHICNIGLIDETTRDRMRFVAQRKAGE